MNRMNLLCLGEEQQPWDNDLTLEFLEHYKNEPMIWNPSHSQNKNKVVIMEAWERIRHAMSVNCTVEELKRKKESLMTTYRIHVRKRKRDPDYRCSWFAYKKMDSFLSNIYFAEGKQQDYSDHEYSSNEIKTENLSRLSVHKRKFSDSVYISPHDRNYQLKKRDTSYSRDVRPVYHHTRAKEMDECDLYAQLLAKKLRRLDEDQRDIAMHEIDNIMYQVIMSKSHSHNSSLRTQVKSKSPVFVVSEQETEHFEEIEHLDYDEIEDPIDDDS